MDTNKITLVLISENNTEFINQSKLCLFSFRQNAGKIKDIPIIFITNENPLSDENKIFFETNFNPIKFVVGKNVIKRPLHAAKWQVFDAVLENESDITIFMDCDTVVLKSLDDMLNPILNDGYDFICRRGGETDRSNIKNIENTMNFLGIGDSSCFAEHNGELERPKFNSGVFVFKTNLGKKIGEDCKKILPIVMNKDHILAHWVCEQFVVALSCIKNNLKVYYMDEVYNSWGNLPDIKILHCFKSRYKFNRKNMFRDFNNWRNNYGEIIGERLLIEEIEKFIKIL
jgi:hypothetical protein